MTTAWVIGAGPAGLMAADVMSAAGLRVTVVDAMPSFGRKFLMAGKSGLNLTKAEPLDRLLTTYPAMPPALQRALSDFAADEVMAWAEDLGQPLFAGSTGRVFPKVMKASPLLRAWLNRLAGQGVTSHMRWDWHGWHEGALLFQTPEGVQTMQPDVTVLALGGASWSRLGANGRWADYLPDHVARFEPANVGLNVRWSDKMHRFFGKPIKAVAWSAGDLHSRGEAILAETGLEGGGIYTVSAAIRDGAPLTVDLLPDWSMERVASALAKPRGKTSLSNHLRKVLRLDQVRVGLLTEFGRPFPDDLAPLIKSLPVRHAGLRPLDEAISTAGGVRFDALTDDLMLRDRPGVFCAGEMLDWEAPTGGYLITACLATGHAAGLGAIRYATER